MSSLVSRFDELPLDQIDRIIETLRSYLTAERIDRIEASLASRTRDVVIVLEDIYSDHNASAVLRTAEAMGLIEGHIVQKTYPFRVSRKISSGAHKWLDLKRHQNADTAYASLKQRGYAIWAADVHASSIAVSDIETAGKVALVFGNEHEGLSPEAVAAADGCFRVPMHGFVESLNISVAAAISMHDVVSRRRSVGHFSGLDEVDARRLRAAWYALSVRAARQLLAQGGLPVPAMTREPLTFVDEPAAEDSA